MVHVSVAKEEELFDNDGAAFVVYVLSLRIGMKRWTIRRKWKALVQLDSLLRANFAEACSTALGPTPLPREAPGRPNERQAVEEFLGRLCASSYLMDTSPARQFLEIPSSRAMLDLSNDPTRSILSAKVYGLVHKSLGFKLPKAVPARTEVADVFVLVVAAATFVPVFLGLPLVAQPIASALAFCTGLWYFSQKDGLLDLGLTTVFGEENLPIARDFVRPADMPGVWGLVGALVGMGLMSSNTVVYVSTVSCARLAVIIALANLAFLSSQKDKKNKL